jgi:hypothetical protein
VKEIKPVLIREMVRNLSPFRVFSVFRGLSLSLQQGRKGREAGSAQAGWFFASLAILV